MQFGGTSHCAPFYCDTETHELILAAVFCPHVFSSVICIWAEDGVFAATAWLGSVTVCLSWWLSCSRGNSLRLPGSPSVCQSICVLFSQCGIQATPGRAWLHHVVCGRISCRGQDHPGVGHVGGKRGGPQSLPPSPPPPPPPSRSVKQDWKTM